MPRCPGTHPSGLPGAQPRDARVTCPGVLGEPNTE